MTEEYPGSDHHGNLTANDLVSSAVVVSSDPGTVYLDQGGVALAELLPGTVSIPVSGTGEGIVNVIDKYINNTVVENILLGHPGTK